MSSFNPRLTAPSMNNKFYNSNINPFVPAGYGMFQNGGNCTCYAFGRAYEILNSKPRLYTGNAETWFPHTTDGYKRGTTPKLGAIICFEGIGTKAGHVAVVEQINSNGSIVTSNSGWRSSLFYTQTLYPPNYNIGSSYRFQGFIYIADFGTPISENTKIKDIQSTLNSRYGYKLSVDGIVGNDTKKHLVMALQTELNKQFKARLKVDGVFGAKTKSKCPVVSKNDKGNITYLIQAELVCKGYNLTLDSVYGSETQNAVKSFQKNSGLLADGIVGKNTFEKLFK